MRQRRKGHLKHLGVKQRTLLVYRAALVCFQQWLRLMGFRTPVSTAELDLRAAAHLNHLFQEGESLARGGHFLSAVRRFAPAAKHALHTAQLWYANWKSTTKPVRALPLPVGVLKGFAGLALATNRIDLAALLAVGFLGLLRTGEIVSLQPQQCLFQSGGHKVVLSLTDTKTSGRNAGIEEIVIHDQVACALLRLACKRTQPTKPIYSRAPSMLKQDLVTLGRMVGLVHPQLTGYSIRRGGASWHFLAFHSLDATTLLGRWKQKRTARLYIAGAAAEIASWHIGGAGRALLLQAERVLIAVAKLGVAGGEASVCY